MESASRAQTITSAHYQASFARIGSETKTFHGRENTMLIDQAWTLWLGLLSIFSLHVLPRTIMLPSSTSTKLSKLLASNALRFGCSTLVSSFKNGSWCRLFSVALHHKSVLVPPSPNPGSAPVLLKTVPSLSSLAGEWSRCCRAAIRSWCPIFPRRRSFTSQLHADGVVLPADSVLASRMPWMLCPGGVANVALPLASLQPNPKP